MAEKQIPGNMNLYDCKWCGNIPATYQQVISPEIIVNICDTCYQTASNSGSAGSWQPILIIANAD
jgi:hypothetical protein